MLKKPSPDTMNAIEGTLAKYYAEGRDEEQFLYQFRRVAERAISGRIAYELLEEADNHVNLERKYDFGKIWTLDGGIYVSLDKISKKIWIPQNFGQILNTENKYGVKEFQILSPDEINAFVPPKPGLEPIEPERMLFLRRVLYCWDENKSKIGKKSDLFLNDADWRLDARKYSVMLLETMQQIYKNPDLRADLKNPKNKSLAEESYNGIDLITGFYLNEMK